MILPPVLTGGIVGLRRYQKAFEGEDSEISRKSVSALTVV
jgi:hypothetical protein